jgi:peptidoglycan/LPS O-acetylase OafA/YrhL
VEPTKAPRVFPGIDLLRALAALLVLGYHIVELGQWTAVANEGFGYVIRRGWVGVDLFLTISGFVIALSALDGVQKLGDGFRRPFAIRRLARIVPLYLLTCAAFVLLVMPHLLLLPAGTIAVHVASHLLFVHNLHPSTHGSINGPTWSVALEMQFYLFILLVGPWLARARPLRFLLAALAVAALWRLGVSILLPPGSVEPIIQFIYQTQLPGVIDQFAFGMALALVVHHGGSPVARWLAPGWRNFAAWLALASLLLLAATELDQAYSFWNARAMVVGWRPLLGAGFAALLAAAMTLPLAGHPVLKPLRYLGDISYGIYLWHMLVLLALMRGIPGLGGWYLAAYATGGTLLLAAMSWHLLEKPNLQKYKGHLAGLRP